MNNSNTFPEDVSFGILVLDLLLVEVKGSSILLGLLVLKILLHLLICICVKQRERLLSGDWLLLASVGVNTCKPKC